MRLAQAFRVGAWLLVGLNLLMALGSIVIFIRMAPAIAEITERNGRSLNACEDMLASLALVGNYTVEEDPRANFMAALERAKNNITEAAEPAVLQAIESSAAAALNGDLQARGETVAAIVRLGNINSEAMVIADRRARQLGHAGAWGVVFMAICIFLAGMIFISCLARRVVNPLEEIHTVLAAHRNGETRRRCTGVNLVQDMRTVFNGINEILDQCQSQAFAKREINEKKP